MTLDYSVDPTGLGRLGIACVHCTQYLAPDEGVTLSRPATKPDPVKGITSCLEYAHRECEERLPGIAGKKNTEHLYRTNVESLEKDGLVVLLDITKVQRTTLGDSVLTILQARTGLDGKEYEPIEPILESEQKGASS